MEPQNVSTRKEIYPVAKSVIDADNDQGDNSIRQNIRDGKFVLELKCMEMISPLSNTVRKIRKIGEILRTNFL